jgi:glutaminyl-tRNA synthetase
VSGDLAAGPSDFIRQRIREELADGRCRGVVTRFPPEPNGYLHIGHAKSICLNFGVAAELGGRCHLRFDDTNPAAEDPEYVRAIQEDVRWLGFDWGEHLYHASDYFEQLHAWAVELIGKGRAFVCDLSSEEILARRGTLTEPGIPSPHRGRSVEENLDLFARMRAGEFKPGSRVLRARIDMGSPVLTMRDPVLWRILDVPHHRTGGEWCIYPLYDFAHGFSDAIEGITHSLCTLEFADHRPLYDWLLDQVDLPARPQQIEFARLNLTWTVMSKRLLRELVEGGHVSGWDDPRMPTLSAMRRRGYPPEAIRRFCEDVGVARRDNLIELGRLEAAVRSELNRSAQRRLAVLRPLRVVIESWPEDRVDELEVPNHPDDPAQGTRRVPFSRVLYVERDDFLEDPPKKFFRLAPGREVRLRSAYLVTCTGVVKDERGEVVELRCSHDPQSRGGDAPDGRKVKATLHWVSAAHAVPAEVRLYDVLFTKPDPTEVAEGEDFTANLSPRSLEVCEARVEPALAATAPGERFQLERLGYFCVDRDSAPGRLVLNRSVTLRDSWAKVAERD